VSSWAPRTSRVCVLRPPVALWSAEIRSGPSEGAPLLAAHAGGEGIVFRIGKSKRRHPRHGKIVETAKQLIVEWSNELCAVVDRLTKLGPDIRPTLICNLRGKPFTESGFRSNWHRLMQKAVAKGAIT